MAKTSTCRLRRGTLLIVALAALLVTFSLSHLGVTNSAEATAGHDVGVAGMGLGFNMPNSVKAPGSANIQIRLQNFGSVTENEVGYKVVATCSGTCTGTVT